jgi:hypothetical protein
MLVVQSAEFDFDPITDLDTIPIRRHRAMDKNRLRTMSDAELVGAWHYRNDSIDREERARARGDGFWCGTPYLTGIAWRELITEELRRRGHRCPE